MSSRTAACGQPPVSMARIREGARALWRVRNSASSLSGGSGVSFSFAFFFVGVCIGRGQGCVLGCSVGYSLTW
jgi:hypothetical protein